MLTDLLIRPVLELIPGPLKMGASAAAPDLDLLVVDALPAVVGAAVQGGAGMAMVDNLTKATSATLGLVDAGHRLDDIAQEANGAVNACIADLTVEAVQCMYDVYRVLAAGAATGPGAVAIDLAVAPIVAKHVSSGLLRLADLSAELDALTGQVAAVDIPGAPTPPSTAPLTEGLRQAADQVAAIPAASEPPTGMSPAALPGPSAAEETAIPVAPANVAPLSPSAAPGSPSPQASAAVQAALSAVGTPYQWGGTSPGVGLDCSGLTQWAYSQAGVQIPRTAAEQAVGPQIAPDQLAPGDLAVWDGHVAMVIGDGQMVEAGDPVEVSPIRTENMGMGFHGFFRPTG
ncbi:C40 family peptidase [Corynebacterium heidelbergense]|nr:C40 family peptidase [Corynebacterium heidelbergense]